MSLPYPIPNNALLVYKLYLSKLLTVFEIWMWFYGFLALFFNEMVVPLVTAGIVTCLREIYRKIRRGEVFTP